MSKEATIGEELGLCKKKYDFVREQCQDLVEGIRAEKKKAKSYKAKLIKELEKEDSFDSSMRKSEMIRGFSGGLQKAIELIKRRMI